MNGNRTMPPPEKPRSEPEIIPPRAGAHSQWRDTIWISGDESGTHRIYIRRLGPFGVILLALATGFIVALLLIVLVGALLLWIPVVATLITIAIISALLRGAFQQRR